MKELDIQKLKDGKYYKGYCMNFMVNGRILEFNSDEEAIKFYADYEADCYKFILVKGEVQEKCIYNPHAYFE